MQGDDCARLWSAASALGAQAIYPARTTTTPIEHLIVVVGENISFDNPAQSRDAR
jgi:phospholipase C